MKLNIKPQSRILIAPYSSMSKSFKEYLEEHYKINFQGYIDGVKEGSLIYKPEKVNSLEYDFIYIISPNYGVEIYKNFFQLGVKKSSIRLFIYGHKFEKTSILSLRLIKRYTDSSLNLKLFIYKKLKKIFVRKSYILLLAPDFVDVNIKDLYIYLDKNTHYKVNIATNNKKQKILFSKLGFNVVIYPSIKFIYYSLLSKIKILDHSPVEKELIYSLKNSKVIQIWHGIPLKKIGHLANYKIINYDVLISTSDFVTNYAFSKLFRYKKVINAGYPRNDILINKNIDSKNLALVDNGIYNFIKGLKVKLLVYMPTWRPDTSIKNPIDLTDLNQFAKQNNIFILIKQHPFTRENSFYHSVLDTSRFNYCENYEEHIMFYPTTDDIYPILVLSDALITDYSSVYFDYLLLDKPILFFLYDKETYIKTHGDFMLDIDEDTPGIHATTYSAFKKGIISILSHDQYRLEREKLKRMLFAEHTYESSCAYIHQEIIKLTSHSD